MALLAPGPVAAAPDDARAVARPDRGLDPRTEGSAAARDQGPAGAQGRSHGLVACPAPLGGAWPAITLRAAASSVAPGQTSPGTPCVLASLGARDPGIRQRTGRPLPRPAGSQRHLGRQRRPRQRRDQRRHGRVRRACRTRWRRGSREPDGKTSPEELLAAAHAACYAMSLAGELTRAGTPPEHLDVTCDRHARPGRGRLAPDRRVRAPRARACNRYRRWRDSSVSPRPPAKAARSRS